MLGLSFIASGWVAILACVLALISFSIALGMQIERMR